MGAWTCLIAILALGFVWIRALWPAPAAWSAADPLRLAAAPVVGLGIAASLYFFVRIALGQSVAAVFGALAAALALGVVLAWKRTRGSAPDRPAAGARAPVWLWVLFAASGVMVLFTFLMLHAAAPHGEWDAWSIWNLRARFFFRSQEFVSPFSQALAWSHPDYPFLLPGAVALLWHAGGAESTGIAGAVSFLFLLSSIAVPFFGVWLMRGPALALICALSIAGASSLVRIGASLYADVPLAACIVTAAVFLVYGLESASAGRGPIAVAGLAAAVAAATKNEGLLFCLALLGAHCLSLAARSELAPRLRALWPLAAGMAIPLALVWYFKWHFAPQNDLVNASKSAVFSARIVDFSRYWATFWAFVGEFLTFGNVLVPPVIVFSVWLALVRLRVPLSGAAVLPLIAAGLQLAGYFAIFVLSPNDLDFQLNAVPRLLLHVWPLAVTGIFLISRDFLHSVPQPSPSGARSK